MAFCRIQRNIKKKIKNNREKRRKYRSKNRLQRKKYEDEYVKANKEKLQKYRKNYRIENKDKMNEYVRYYSKYKISINSKIASVLRTRIACALRDNKISKSKSSKELLGCDIQFFKEYIESKFTKGMTWANRGNGGWHLDHIKPCKSFNLNDVEQQKLCFNYKNIQPLWATTEIAMKYGEGADYIGNLEKSDKIL